MTHNDRWAVVCNVQLIEITPTGKLRVGIGISAAGGAYWSNKNEAGGYSGVPVDLGRELAAPLGLPVEYVA